MGGLAPELGEPGRVHRLLAGRPLGQRLELEERRPVLEHPGRRQPDPRRRRVVVGRLGRLVPRPRRLGADGERRRDHDRGVQLPPGRHVRHAHDLQVQLDVAERLHPHQGHRRPQHRGAGRHGAPRRSARRSAPPTASGARPTSSSTTSGSPTATRSRVPPRRSFRPTAAQLGKRLRAKVIATKSGSHTGSATSPPTDSVAHGVFAMTAGPVISGTPQVGVPLSAGNGTWSPAGTYTYHWYAGSTLIPDASTSTYTPTAAELGQADQGEGHLQARRLHETLGVLRRSPTRSRPDSSRPPRRRRSPARRRSTRSSPRARAPGPRRASSTCSGWPTASPSTAPPVRRTP